MQELDNTTPLCGYSGGDPGNVQDLPPVRRLIRAYNLEKALDTPAKIYYKFEGNNTSGSHKLELAPSPRRIMPRSRA